MKCLRAAAAVLAVSVAWFGPGATAGAEPQWSQAGPSAVGTEVELAAGPTGSTLAVWSVLEGYDAVGIAMAERDSGGRFGPPEMITSAPADSPSVAMDGAGGAVIAWRELRPDPARGSHAGLRTVFRSPDGRLGPIETIPGPEASTRSSPVNNFTLRVNARGDALLVWLDGIDGRIHAALRPVGGHFGAPEPVSAAENFSPPAFTSSNIALGPRAEVAVAYEGGRRASFNPGAVEHQVDVALRPPRGQFVVERFFADESPIVPELAFDGAGTLVALFGRSSGHPYVPDPEGSVRVTARPPGGSFSPPTVLSAEGAQVPHRPALAANLLGNMTALWTEARGLERAFWASTRPTGGTFGAEGEVLKADQRDTDPELRLGAGGAAAISWTRIEDRSGSIPRGRVFAAAQLSGAAFGPPTPLSTTMETFGRDFSGHGPKLAVDGRGDAVAAWRFPDRRNCIQFAAYGELDGPPPGTDGCLDPAGSGVDAGVPPLVDILGVSQRLRSGGVALRARCNQACSLSSGGRLTKRGRSAALRPGRSLLSGGRTSRVLVKLSPKARRLLERERGNARARIKVSAVNSLGRRRTVGTEVRLSG